MTSIPAEPFRRVDLEVLGIPDFTLRRWLIDGRVRRVFAGVYCSRDVDDSLELRASCAALVLREDAVVCDRSAAWLWGVEAWEPEEVDTMPDLELCVPPGMTPPKRPGILASERDLADAEIVTVGGVRVTTPVRTALDLACRKGRWQAQATLDAFMRACAVTYDDYSRALVRFAGRRGVSQARELVAFATPLAESRPESWVRRLMVDDGLPEPELQVELTLDGIAVRLDLAYRRWRIAIEYDGEEFHGEAHRGHDEARRRLLRAHGWWVVVVRKHQFRPPASTEWLDEVALKISERRGRRTKQRYARGSQPWIRGV